MQPMCWLVLLRMSSSQAVDVMGSDKCPTSPFQHKHLKQIWQKYSETHLLHKEDVYANYYAAHLPARALKDEPCEQIKMLEIGVQSGGSTRAWKQYYGSQLYYVGVDINPLCKRSRSEQEGIYIEIGSQSDANFMLDVCKRHGPFNIIIDDGAHSASMIKSTLELLFANETCMAAGSAVYAIEDSHTMMWANYNEGNPSNIHSIAGDAWWSMHADWAGKQRPYRTEYPCKKVLCSRAWVKARPKRRPVYNNLVSALHLYDSMAFIMRSTVARPVKEIKRGSDVIPYTYHTPT